MAANLIASELDLFFCPEYGFFEFQVEHILQVPPPPRPVGVARAPPPKTEVETQPGAEHLADVVDIEVAAIWRPAESIQPGMPEAVVGSPFVIIGEDGIGFIDLFKAFFRVWGIAYVGVVFARPFAESGFDLIR
jgi:hypothetical protein